MDSLATTEGIIFKRPKLAPSKLREYGKRKRPAKDAQESLDPGLDIFRTYEEPSDTISRRLELYDQNLEHLQLCLKKTQDKFNKDLSTKLIHFVRSSFQLIDEVDSVIPIGILESGLSVGENSVIFDYIESELKKLPKDIPEKVFVSRIQSGANSSTKAVFQRICGQLLNEGELYVDGEESEDSSPVKKGGAIARNRHFSIYDVKTFLKSVKENYKIVVIIEDVESFTNLIITQILTMLGSARLPIVFLFGATHGQFIHNLVPLNCSCEYVLDTFYVVSPQERFNEFMRLILLDPHNPFRVSGPIVSYLDSHYLEVNFSVEQIANSMKFCLHYHFLTAKSAFCSFKKSDSYNERELECFSEACKGTNKETPRKRMKANQDTPEEQLDSTVEVYSSWLFYLRLICYLNLRLPDCPLGDTYSQIYASCYEGYSSAKEHNEEDRMHRFFKTLGSLSKSDLQSVLEDCISFLKKGNFPQYDLAKDILVEFEELITNLKEAEQQAKSTSENTDEAKSMKVKLRKVKSIKDLQQNLMEKKRQTEGSSKVHEVRTALTEKLRKLLKLFFPALSSLRHSEVFVFSDLNQLINSLYPANFLQVNEDITSPGYVLQCDCCTDVEPTSIDANLPDVSIIHKLFAEHTTKKVDLNLIYHAFLSVVHPKASNHRKSKAGNAKEAAAVASCLIRFRRAVGELQHTGFIKRAKSKPDEVSRLTWW